MKMIFKSRREAGHLLGKKLRSFGLRQDPLILALPRGGVPVAFEIALELDGPLDVFTVRKLGVPGHEELAMGAIATGGFRVLDEDVVRSLGIPAEVIDAVAVREERELHRRERYYRPNHATPTVEDRVVILVDDGLATGSPMLAAVRAVRSGGAAHVLVAVPVASRTAVRKLRKVADEVIALSTPEWFNGVGQWYQDFTQTTDDEVCEFLRMAKEKQVAHQ
jgi:predicted phosphoribosyltransferase